MTTKRPGIVTFVVVLTFIQAAVLAVGSLTAFFMWAVDPESLHDTPLNEGTLLATGIGYGLVAIATLFVAMYLARGSRTARTLVAVVMGFGIAAAIAVMVLHHTSAYIASGLGQILFSLFILWALYGNDKADAYFAEIEA